MSTETLHMRIGSNLGEILLDIAQNNIKTGNILILFKVLLRNML